MNSGKPLNNRPVNRFELIDNLYELIQAAKESGEELMLVETWQLAWLVTPEHLRLDPDGTGEIAFNFDPADVTQPHQYAPVKVVSAVDYIRLLDCDMPTEEYQT